MVFVREFKRLAGKGGAEQGEPGPVRKRPMTGLSAGIEGH
jgi:hypothetical protein